jgi:hypothetical protein
MIISASRSKRNNQSIISLLIVDQLFYVDIVQHISKNEDLLTIATNTISYSEKGFPNR